MLFVQYYLFVGNFLGFGGLRSEDFDATLGVNVNGSDLNRFHFLESDCLFKIIMAKKRYLKVNFIVKDV